MMPAHQSRLILHCLSSNHQIKYHTKTHTTKPVLHKLCVDYLQQGFAKQMSDFSPYVTFLAYLSRTKLEMLEGCMLYSKGTG